MLPALNRLKRPRDISRAQRQGRFLAFGQINLRSVSNGHSFTRVVIVVSKKVSNKATVRNRIRRRLASTLRSEWATVASGYDIVILVQGDIAELPVPEINKMIAGAFDKAGLRTKP